MDGQRFDALARTLADASTRRSIAKALLGGAGAALLSSMGLDGLAFGQGTCRGSGRLCSDHAQCCSARCDPTTERCACQDGELYCEGACVSVAANPVHCGSCGVQCDEGKVCCGGRCRESCPTGKTYDGKTCRCVCAPETTTCGNSCCATDQTCSDRGCCARAGGTCSDTRSCCSGLTCCDGRCVDTTSDPTNCGGCGEACDYDPYLCQAPTCTDGVCGTRTQPDDTSCVPGDDTYACCGDVCADLYEEPHCGACNLHCAPNETCCRGEGCFDMTSSTDHCGGCFHTCDPSQTCVQGVCCPSPGGACAGDGDCCPGHACCQGSCVDVAVDVANCGSCGTTCGASDPCYGGVCGGQPPAPAGPGEQVPAAAGNTCGYGVACAQGLGCCRGVCADFQSDPANCGGCVRSCRDGQTCLDGVCEGVVAPYTCGEATCGDGERCCGSACLDVANDPGNCGACGVTCGEAETCCRGACYAACPEGTTWDAAACSCRCDDGRPRCGGAASGFCCARDERCDGGACATRTALASVAAEACRTTADCGEGQTCCNGQCALALSDPAHCGACGYVCRAGEECCDGRCRSLLTCLDCGACGNACPQGSLCRDGRCICANGEPPCDGVCRDYQTDRDNCGGCGSTCPPGETCTGGYCDSDQAPCDCTDGQVCCAKACVDPVTDPAHCGACGAHCPDDPTACLIGSCEDSSCGTQLAPDGTACDEGDPYRACCAGACVDLRTNGEHCGDCGVECPYGYSCCDGTCINTQAVAHHCGDCATACRERQICERGACVAAPCREDGDCSPGAVCCDGDCADLATDLRHCGQCREACRVTEVCAEGSCCSPVGRSCGDGDRCCAGAICDRVRGTCANATCQTDEDCPRGARCADGTCIETCAPPRSCRTSDDCGSSNDWFCAHYGENGVCFALCATNRACCEDDLCAAPSHLRDDGSSYCVTPCRYDHECPEGWTCYLSTASPDGTCGPACTYRAACSVEAQSCCPGEICCRTTCTDVRVDTTNCGECGRTCATGETCYRGECRPIAGTAGDPCDGTNACATGLSCCGGYCTDTETETTHCGNCDVPCESGWNCCGGTCYDPRTDLDHCGGCDGTCPRAIDPRLCQRRTCEDGVCGYRPAPDSTRCDIDNPAYLCCGEVCVDTDGSDDHCSACGAPCSAGTHCEDGTCRPATTTAETCDATSCPDGWACCDGQCHDLQLDNDHCGSCGDACAADAFCCDGRCRPAAYDPENCGGCGIACPPELSCGLHPEGRSGSHGLIYGCCIPLTATCDPAAAEDLCCGDSTCGVRPDGATNVCCWQGGAGCPQPCTVGGDCEWCCSGYCGDGNKCADRPEAAAACPDDRPPCDDACCEAGTKCCAGICTDTLVNNAHCGACDHACPEDSVCQNGTCASDTADRCAGTAACSRPGDCPSRADCVGGSCLDRCARASDCCAGEVCVNVPSAQTGYCLPGCDGSANCGADARCCEASCYLDGGGEPGFCVYCADVSVLQFSCGSCGVICEHGSCENGTCVATRPDQCASDTNPPTITCPANLMVQSGQSVRYDSPTVTANCSDVTVVCTPPVGSDFPDGTTPVTCTATDVAAKSSSCTFTVTVAAEVAPTITGTTCSQDGECLRGHACCGAQCVDTETDQNNCGACGTTCPRGTRCDGSCVACTPGQTCTEANEGTAIGCCAREFCNGRVCESVRNREFETCQADEDCVPGLLCCEGTCRNPSTSDDHCGTCGHRCQYGSICCSGLCTSSDICPPDYRSSFMRIFDNCVCFRSDGRGCSLAGSYGCGCCEGLECRNNLCVPAVGVDCAAEADGVVCGTSGEVCCLGVCCAAGEVCAAGGCVDSTPDPCANDTIAPSITCPANIEVSGISDQCSATVRFSDPTADDTCSIPTITCNPASGSIFPVGITTVTCVARDAVGNSALCSFDIIVADTTAPTVICPEDATVALGADFFSWEVGLGDNCPGATVTCNPSSVSTEVTGTTVVTCTAVDAAGNTSSCSFTASVQDRPPSETLSATTGDRLGQVPDAEGSFAHDVYVRGWAPN